MRRPRTLVRALTVAVISAPTLLGCGGAPPEGEECVEPPAASAVGTISFALTDASRGEDATSAPDDHRELLVTAFYPAIDDPARPLAPCFRGEGEAALNAESWGLPPSAFEGPCGEARLDAEAAGTEPLPVLIFSHGYGTPIAFYTSWLERLAGRGYLVLGVTHPYAANVTVLPSGVIARSPEMPGALGPLVAGLSLDQRAVIEALRHAAPGSPAGRLAEWWDGAQVGVVGHSVGGAAAAATCRLDPHVRACANLDGTMDRDTAEQGMAAPFFLAASSTSFASDATFAQVWEHLHGPGYRLELPSAGHDSFTDFPFWIDRLGGALDPSLVELGTIDPRSARAVTSALLAAFFDRHVRSREAPLLDGESPCSEATFSRR